MLTIERPPPQWSLLDHEIVARIRQMRRSADPVLLALLSHPERLMYHLTVDYHGHVKLRPGLLAKELGVEMRTLERTFMRSYGKSMRQHQTERRLIHAVDLLREDPPIKHSAIANTLGYDEARDFTRFFKKQTQQTPSDWSRKHRNKAGSSVKHS